MPACSSGTLTNVLSHRNARHRTPHPSQYRHGVDLSLCYPFMWNVTLEYTATHFNVLGETRPGNPSPTFHTHQRTLNLMLLWWLTVGSSVESTVPTGSWTRDLWCANPLRYPLAHSDFLLIVAYCLGTSMCHDHDILPFHQPIRLQHFTRSSFEIFNIAIWMRGWGTDLHAQPSAVDAVDGSEWGWGTCSSRRRPCPNSNRSECW